jgi:N-acetylneuraminate synthase
MIAFSSPFDETAVDFLETLNVPCYKIASFENTHIPLIKKVAATGKPIIISTGMASVEELDESVNAARNEGCKDIILLKCTSSYPATPNDSNLRTLPDLCKRYDCEVGLSDHTLGIGAALAAISLGATVIEKHFTLDRSDGGVDSQFSMEPEEMALLAKESEAAWLALGNIHYGPTEDEKETITFRRSIYISQDMNAGDIINANNARVIRPGFGLAPKYFHEVLGKRVKVDVKCGTPLSWDLLN